MLNFHQIWKAWFKCLILEIYKIFMFQKWLKILNLSFSLSISNIELFVLLALQNIILDRQRLSGALIKSFKFIIILLISRWIYFGYAMTKISPHNNITWFSCQWFIKFLHRVMLLGLGLGLQSSDIANTSTLQPILFILFRKIRIFLILYHFW